MQYGPSTSPKHPTNHGQAETSCRSCHFCQLSQIDVNSLLPFEAHRHASFVVMFLPQICAVFATPCSNRGRTEALCFPDFQSSFDSSHHLQVGSYVLAALANNCQLKNVV